MEYGAGTVHNPGKGVVRTETCSSIRLQLLLHYNGLLSLVYYPLSLAVQHYKLTHFWAQKEDRYMALIVPVICGLVEIVRLRAGVDGNLHEQPAKLAVFVLLTILPQTCGVLFLGIVETLSPRRYRTLMPFDYASSAVFLTFYILEIWCARTAIRKIVTKQASDFKRLYVVTERTSTPLCRFALTLTLYALHAPHSLPPLRRCREEGQRR